MAKRRVLESRMPHKVQMPRIVCARLSEAAVGSFFILICAAPAFWPSTGSALQWTGPPPTLSWRVGQSDVVALGRVGRRENIIPSSSDSIPIVPQVFSRFAFVVAEAWKGNVVAGDTITFAKVGGVLPGRGWIQIGGDTHVSEGDTLVLFLERGPIGIWKSEMVFSWHDGYVRIEGGRGCGVHCKDKSLAWLRKRVLSAVHASSHAPNGTGP